MNRVIIEKSSGKILKILSGSMEILDLNTKTHDYFVDTELDIPSSGYWDGLNFVSISTPPSPHHYFDYIIKDWVDLRSLDEIKAQRWTEIKSERDRLEFGGFEFDGDIYDSDQVSQSRIMGAAAAGMDQVWTLADNTTTYLTANELVQLYQALQMHIAITHQRGRVAREAIVSATTKDDVDAVTL